MVAAEPVEVVYRGGLAMLYLAVGLFLAYAPPQAWPKRLLGLVFTLLGAQQVVTLGSLVLVPLPGGEAAWDATWEDIRLLRNLALAGFLWLYPTRASLRRWTGIAVAAFAGFLVLDTALWFLARGFLQTEAGWEVLLHGTGYGHRSLLAIALAAGFARVWELPQGERPGAYLVLAAAGFNLFPAVGIFFARIVAGALGFEALAFEVPQALRDFCCGVPEATTAVTVGLGAGLTLWLAARGRTLAPLLVAGWSALGTVLGAAAPPEGTAAFPHILALVLPIYAVARHGALGIPPPGRRTAAVLGGTMFLALFLLGQTFALALTRDPLAVSVGLLGSLGMGALGAWAVLPGGAAPAAVPGGPDAERRLAPYQAALAAEIAAGADLESTTRKLLGLRRELGVTDTEHALMDFTLRRSGAGAAAPGPALAAGALFAGRYRVLRGLGADGGGPAHLCRDERVGREVVVKLLRPQAGGGDGGLVAALREARALAAVRHPRVVALHDVEAVGGLGFLVMEHAEGGSLAARLAAGPLGPGAWLRLAGDLLEGLAAAHAAGLVHRDVKPSNVLLDGAGRAQLGDFGVARLPGHETTVGWAGDGDGAVGTVRYMSPEQARGREATARSDLYAAGAVLYEAWTGAPYVAPQAGESPLEVQLRVAAASGFDRPLRGPAALRAFFRKALHPDPEQRFPSAAAMREAALQAVQA